MNDSAGIDDISTIPDETDINVLLSGAGLSSSKRGLNSRKQSEQWEVLLFVTENGRTLTVMTGEIHPSSELALWNAFRKARALSRATGKQTSFGAKLKVTGH